MSKPELPPYDTTTSDGCSIVPFLPFALRKQFQAWTVKMVAHGRPGMEREMQVACVFHDRAYYHGGTERAREYADKALLQRWERIGVPYWFRTLGYQSIRTWGGPGWRTPNVSWAYGGRWFRYDD